ncbi:RBBP9/YdeN family alpha/beta hydrolase [Roseibium sediminis]|uniref:RBBP9/YdeN family alpha/beta hydrolase n=1 Tax=Roseibium sediminis TaxID=1775174 RepID=UPI00123E40F8|nr:alpha/beta fold hydrolase [Roseibium sediminis]
MKIADTDILLVPGYGETPPDHWMQRWQAKMANAWIVEQKDYFKPERQEWEDTLLARLAKTTRPVVLVGHSLGCILIAHAGDRLKDKVRGAYLVAPSDWDRDGLVAEFDGGAFKPIPLSPLPFRTHVVASQNDPYCDFKRAEHFARSWGATLQDAGQVGHINIDSGHGPWPEGMMSFAGFMNKLG